MRVGRGIAVVAIGIVASLSLAACGSNNSPSSSSNNSPNNPATGNSTGGSGSTTAEADDNEGDLTLTLGSAFAPTTFSPQEASDGPAVPWFQVSYDTLIQQRPDGTFTPMLADSWEYNSDSTVLTMKLHNGVTFADGAKFDGSVVKANLEATRDGSGSLAAQLAGIKDVVVPDPLTVEVHLSAPDPALLRTLSQPSGMMTATDMIGSPKLATEPDGTGPYVLDTQQTVVGSAYVFTKRSDYWNTKLTLPYRTIVMKVMTDITARVNALASGQVDAASIDTKSQATVEASGATVVATPAAGLVGLYLFDRAGTIQPALRDVRVRQAINMALDRVGIVKSFQAGLGTATEQIFNPQSGAYGKSLDTTYGFDPAAAKKLMADAGYADGFSIEMPDIAGFLPEATIVAQELSDIGITVTWVKVPQTQMLSEMLSGKYPVILMRLQSTEPWQAVQFFVAPKAAWNPLHSEDPALNDLIKNAQYATPGPAQDAAFKDAAKWLVDNAWFAPLYFPQDLYATGKNVQATSQFMQSVPSIYNYAPAQ